MALRLRPGFHAERIASGLPLRVVSDSNPRRKRPEAAFARQVEGLLDTFGWRWWHDPDLRRCAHCGKVSADGRRAGFPDYVAVRGSRLLFVELKSAPGSLSVDQVRWIADLRNVARACSNRLPIMPEVYVWRPSDADEIVGVLRM